MSLLRSIFAATLLTTAIQASAADTPKNGFSLGAQGGAGMAFANYQSHFAQTNDPKFQNFDQSNSNPLGLAGGNIAYNWFIQDNMISLSLSLNQGIGQIKDLSTVEPSIPEDDESIDLPQKTKLKQQSNLILTWKHLIAPKTYLSVGAGLSALRTSTSLSIVDIENAGNLNETTVSQSQYQYGGVLTAGTEYFFTAHSSLSTDFSCYLYNSSSLDDFDDFYTSGSGVSNVDHLQNRKVTINIMALTLGYSYYF